MQIGIGGNSGNPDYGGYCQIDVTDESLTLKPRWISGSWMDAFEIKA